MTMDKNAELRPPVVETKKENGYWSVYVDGVRTVDRESYQVACNVAHCILHPDARVNTESREVANNILAWRDA